MQQSRFWCFTITDATLQDIDEVKALPHLLLAFGFNDFDVVKETSSCLQGYVELSRRHRVSSVIKLLPHAQWGIRRCTASQAICYCRRYKNFEQYPLSLELQRKMGSPSSMFSQLTSDWQVYASTLKFTIPYCEFKMTSKSFHFYGPTGVGKSKFASAHFKFPFVATSLQLLKYYSPYCYDGIVFDMCSFNALALNELCSLLSREVETNIVTLDGEVTIPVGVPKIFISREKDLFCSDTANVNIRYAIDKLINRVFMPNKIY